MHGLRTKLNLASLLAVAAIAGADAIPAMPRRRVSVTKPPSRAKPTTALQAEIAEHNAEVDRRKAEKKARKMQRGKA